MNPTQKIGQRLFLSVALFTCLLFLGGILASILAAWKRPDLETIGQLLLLLGITVLAAIQSFRDFRMGSSYIRWILLFTLLLTGSVFLVVIAPSIPLRDAVEQAKWEQQSSEFWWMSLLSCIFGISSLIAAGLLLFPQVSHYFHYRKQSLQPFVS